MDLSFDINDLPWPEENTNLFREGQPSPTVATIHKDNRESNWNFYASGYLEAANRLMDSIQDERTMGDFLVYPVVFLFRHYTEIRLKELIVSISSLEGKKEKPKFDHGLQKLWAQCRPLIENLRPSPKPRDIQNVERLILELNSYDPRSTFFRYPNNSEYSDGPKFIDLDYFHIGMEKLAAFLDASSMMVSVYQEENHLMSRATNSDIDFL